MKITSLRPSYLRRRLRQIEFARSYPTAPWISASGVLLLESWLKQTDIGVEWGSGRSTAWFAHRVASLRSIESDPEWHRHVQQLLIEQNVEKKVDYRLVECKYYEPDEPENHAYAEAAADLQDSSLDFALVDGLIRLPCMVQAIRKLKPGGLLILDNANRYVPNLTHSTFATVHEPRMEPLSKKWAEVLDSLRSWRWMNTTDGIWDTRFWVRPC